MGYHNVRNSNCQSYTIFLSKLKTYYFNAAFYYHDHLLVVLYISYILYGASEPRMGGGRHSKSG